MISGLRSPFGGEEFADLLIFYLNNPERMKSFPASAIHYINEAFAVAHLPLSQVTIKTANTYGYSVIPKLYGLASEESVAASGVNRLRGTPNFNLRGSGVLIGFIDTGIDYTNPVFIKTDGTTKIISIWDQNIESDRPLPFNINYGTEYKADEINQALTSENPLEIVPSTDDNGHGTMMAGVAVGNENPGEDFAGVAPDSELIIVKLKQAKKYLKEFFAVSDDVICYQENYIMWGVQYCLQTAGELNRPIVICLGIGSSQGPHDGRTNLDIFLSLYGDYPGTVVVTSLGNEGNRGRHYFGTTDPSSGYNLVELSVGQNEGGFSMELWGDSPGVFSIDILSPNGEYIPRIPSALRVNREIRFIFETTIIYLDYQIAASESGDQLILMRFLKVSPGIWRFKVYGQANLQAGFHIWLPMGDMITENTNFIQPDIYTSLLTPGTALVPIAITTYNPFNNSLYLYASRGYPRSEAIKPDLAAPGVNYVAPNQNKEFVNYSGSSTAAAHTAGLAAMIMEWGVILGNDPSMDSVKVKNYLIRGARRTPNLPYPNREWGYGIVDVFNVFNVLRAE